MDKWVAEVLSNMDLSQSKTLNDIVYEAFFKTIVQGNMPTGERINEKEYAEVMNVSRTPIRYAMKMLESDGLVEYVPRLGVVVKQITKDDAVEIFRIRQALDLLATVTAMNKMSEAEFCELDELLTLTENVNDAGDVLRISELFKEFHDFIYDKCGMIRLKEITVRMKEYLTRFRALSLNDLDRREIAIQQHREMYVAMRGKDEEALREVIENHLNESVQFIVKTIEEERV